MCEHDPISAQRRRLLAAALALPAGALLGRGARAGVYRAEGGFRINGRPARQGRALAPGDRIATAGGSELLLTVSQAAILVRGATEIELGSAAEGGITGLLRVVTGAIQAAFEPGEHRVQTAQATAGIRGTAVYVAASYGRTYLCTCYGTVDIDAGDTRATVSAAHHEPRVISGGRIREGSMRHHSDDDVRRVADAVGQRPFPDWDG